MSIENLVIFDFLDFFGVPKDKKNQKCLMGLFDTSKDAHLKDNFKNMQYYQQIY